MFITEEKLLQWSIQESTDLSSNAYHFVKETLFRLPIVVAHHNDFEAYLQGSYANATNIKRDSDVDIVFQYNGVFRYDDSALTDYAKIERNKYYEKANLSFKQYKNTIYHELLTAISHYTRVKSVFYKPKSLKIILQNPSIEVDVVPCFLYKKYRSFSLQNPDSTSHFDAGISFDNTETDDIIVNFPKQHIENGHNKNKTTDGNYKMTVRFIKKIKSLLVDKNIISENLASSYFIENLIYNVPSRCFETSCLKTLNNIIDFLLMTPLDNFQCQHKQWRLFGSRSTQWNKNDAIFFIGILKNVLAGKYNI